MFVNTIKVKVSSKIYLVFLYLNATLFLGVRSHVKSHVLSQLIVFLALFYPCLQFVNLNLSILLSPCMFVGNPLTSIQVLLIVF